jgi:hypothetical protein
MYQEAVTQDGSAIQFIENPSQVVCILAVENCNYALHFIENQTPRVIRAALKAFPESFEYVKVSNS